jgi:hypothetical protein
MSDFHGKEIKLSEEDCERICLLKAGEITHLEGGYNTASHTDIKVPFGWGTTRIGSNGEGNRGTYFLIPKSPESFSIWREGQVYNLMTKFKTSRDLAETIFKASKGVQYAHEEEVIQYIVTNHSKIKAWLVAFDENNFSSKSWQLWEKEFSMPTLKMSAWRKQAVLSIMSNLILHP